MFVLVGLVAAAAIGRTPISFTLHPTRRRAPSRAICRPIPFHGRRHLQAGLSYLPQTSVNFKIPPTLRGEKVQRFVPLPGIFPSYKKCTAHRIPPAPWDADFPRVLT